MGSGITISTAGPELRRKLAQIEEHKREGGGVYSSLATFDFVGRQEAAAELVAVLTDRFGTPLDREFTQCACHFVRDTMLAAIQARRFFRATQYEWKRSEIDLCSDQVLWNGAPRRREISRLTNSPIPGLQEYLWIPDYPVLVGALVEFVGPETKGRNVPPGALRQFWNEMRESSQECLEYGSSGEERLRTCSLSEFGQIIDRQVMKFAQECGAVAQRRGQLISMASDLGHKTAHYAQKLQLGLDALELPVTYDQIEGAHAIAQRLARELRFGETEGERMLARAVMTAEVVKRGRVESLEEVVAELIETNQKLADVSRHRLREFRRIDAEGDDFHQQIVRGENDLLRRRECIVRALAQHGRYIVREFAGRSDRSS